MVMASESQHGERLDEALLKNITGGEPITVRFLHKEFFTYEPEFKVWMSSNYQPNSKGQGWGIGRRLKRIPFEVTISKESEDKDLKAKFRRKRAEF